MSWRTAANLGWLNSLPGVVRDRPLAGHTSFNLGGPADFMVQLPDAALIGQVLSGCRGRGIPHLLLGAGTNLLVADAGVEGLVIRCACREHRIEGDRIFAGAGLKMMRLARLAAAADLVGLEFAIGVPGTVGGAVYQNAGCWGREVAEVLVRAQGLGPDGVPVTWEAGELDMAYRSSAFRQGRLAGSFISGAWFQLAPGDGRAARALMTRLTTERTRTQPIRTKNCGSVFKNPPGDSAGRLIEAAGLKGAREGGAQVSEVHANFIVNHGEATAADVARLIERTRSAVLSWFGVELETEVEKVGRWDIA